MKEAPPQKRVLLNLPDIRRMVKASLALIVVGGFVGIIVFASYQMLSLLGAEDGITSQEMSVVLGALGSAGGLGILAKGVIDSYFNDMDGK